MYRVKISRNCEIIETGLFTNNKNWAESEEETEVIEYLGYLESKLRMEQDSGHRAAYMEAKTFFQKKLAAFR